MTTFFVPVFRVSAHTQRSCQIDTKAKHAILQLCQGDMRRALNILQACHAANDMIDEDSVYLCTGHPHPQDIETAFQAMLEQEFTTAFQSTYDGTAHSPTSAAIQTLRVEKGLALTDLLTGMHALVLSLELPPHARVFLLDHMAQIEYRLSTNASERVQLSALLASVKAAVELAHTPPSSSS